MTRLTAALVRPETSGSKLGSSGEAPETKPPGFSTSFFGATARGRRRGGPRRVAREFVSAATLAGVLLASAAVASTSACGPELRPAVTLNLKQTTASPSDAAVYIDEEYVGPLSFVSSRGVRLPAGKHRITIEKPGYFPWDREVTADRDAIKLDVQLQPIPE
jgi:hypothetical protein